MLSSARSRRAFESSNKGGLAGSLQYQMQNYRADRALAKRIRAHEDMRFGDGGGRRFLARGAV